LVKAGGPPGYNAQTQLDRLDRGQPLQKALDYPVQTWQFGHDMLMVFLAGEVVVDYSLRLKAELDPARLWVVAYANDVPCYIPSERILREGGYEGGGAMVYYGWPTRLKPGVEDRIDAAVRELTPAEFVARRDSNPPPPQTPKESLRSIRIKPGLKVELVASEPLIESPVAIDWGSDRKLWVCEMRDYPMGMDGHWKPGGRIKLLEDLDGDGRYEKATVFLDDLPFPTGVMAWRKGVLVCAAPEIIYAEDTNGDGKADVRKTLFQGFATENYQARVNGLSYGLDNWVYGANGLIGGVIRGVATGREVNIGGRDFRIRPDSGQMEPASGLTQQGRVRDDWGNQFGGNNSILIQHYPFPDHDARRNPYVASPAPAVYVPRDPDSARIYPASRTLERFNNPESANRVTSACSPMIYRDELLGGNPALAGNAFTCEPVHNLVHRGVLSPSGITFEGHRALDEQKSEFLASSDNWCRPVQVRTGPDGAIYVVDMYRYVIEHPRWISPEQLAQLDVRAGADKGRIYRVVSETAAPRAVPNLDRLSTPELVKALDSPNGTLRDNVQRLLVHRADQAAVPGLRMLTSASALPQCRIQALCTLQGLGQLEPELVRTALRDADPRVRSNAIRLAEPWLATNAAMGLALCALAEDRDARVRFQLALSLGEWDDARAGTILGRLAVGSDDSWIRAAVLSSARKRPGEILLAVLSEEVNSETRQALVEPLLATITGDSNEAGLRLALRAITSNDQHPGSQTWRFGALARMLDARVGRKLLQLEEPHHEAVIGLVASARALAHDPHAAAPDRALAIRLLGVASEGRDFEMLVELLSPRNPSEVQSAAVHALLRHDDRKALEPILAAWGAMAPRLRSEVLDALLARRAGVAGLLAALEAKELPASDIDAAHRQRLIDSSDPTLKRRANQLFATASEADRKAVIESYRGALSRVGDDRKGAALFDRVCAPCHRIGNRGHEIGPDLAALTDKSPEALATAILDPNREVDARYVEYLAALADGRVISGMIASETANAITLKRQEGQQDVILRADLESFKATGRSLMPEGLERDVSLEQLADLIAFLAGTAPPKAFTGNRPETLHQAPDGAIRLDAKSAAIFGRTLAFEPEPGNLGYWHSDDDRAAWTFQVDRPGTFTVSMEWACAEDSAGNSFQIRAGERTITGKVGSTGIGTWANYRSIFVGELRLKSGTHRLEFRAAGPIRGTLLDLKAVVLSPRKVGD
jgi:putative membrane-bound dehydrogenase-like protein